MGIGVSYQVDRGCFECGARCLAHCMGLFRRPVFSLSAGHTSVFMTGGKENVSLGIVSGYGRGIRTVVMTLRLFQWVLLVMSAIVASTIMVRAEPQQEDVLSCFAEMGVETTWGTCLETMFAPCAENEIGSSDHIGCLADERESWRAAKFEAETEVLARLTEGGMAELSGLMLAWPQFVEDKCAAVAEGRADISFEAASLGCQISELALLTNEMTACLNGRSEEPYCQLRDE